MPDINWSILQPVDIGGNFRSGFQMGQQLVEKAKLKSALAAYAQDPANPASQNALAAASPEFAMQLPGMRAQSERAQRELREKQVEAHRDNIVKGAELIREWQPKDDASWQQVRAQAAQLGIDVSEVPEHFDPNYVEGVVKVADTFAPRKTGDLPNVAKEADYYRSIGKPELAEQLLARHAEGPPVVANNGDGTFTIVPRQMLRGGSADQGAIPPPPPGFVIEDDGGPAPGAPGGFL